MQYLESNELEYIDLKRVINRNVERIALSLLSRVLVKRQEINGFSWIDLLDTHRADLQIHFKSHWKNNTQSLQHFHS
jgi:hypothetical protein